MAQAVWLATFILCLPVRNIVKAGPLRVLTLCSLRLPAGSLPAGRIKNSGHDIGIAYEVSFNPHTIESDIAH